MPRKGRIDFPGALHHVVIRGINLARIFQDDNDRREFIRRLKIGLEKTGLSCYAWALIPNHVHLLLRTGVQSLTALMRSLLTGYALYFNRRYKRVGYLFQNRYKSILCDEEAYLLQLVRYIHLNPLRAGLVSSLQELNRFPWCGHSVLLGQQKASWQDVDSVLGLFASTVSEARKSYLEFVKEGIPEGKRADLTGGGLLRSGGGWRSVRGLKKAGARQRGDERILGGSGFVQRALEIAEEQLTKREQRRAAGWDLMSLLDCTASLFDTNSKRILLKRREKAAACARALFAWWATEELGFTITEVADFLSISTPAVSKAASRGYEFCQEKGLLFQANKLES